jgi:hypothetical protein
MGYSFDEMKEASDDVSLFVSSALSSDSQVPADGFAEIEIEQDKFQLNMKKFRATMNLLSVNGPKDIQ